MYPRFVYELYIDLVDMITSSPTPQQKDIFWAPESNKRNLQKLMRDIVQNRPDRYQFSSTHVQKMCNYPLNLQ